MLIFRVQSSVGPDESVGGKTRYRMNARSELYNRHCILNLIVENYTATEKKEHNRTNYIENLNYLFTYIEEVLLH